MSDVELARAGWAGRIFLTVVTVLALAWEAMPVMITRSRYRALVDSESLVDHAHRALTENARLRALCEPDEIEVD